MEAEKVFYKKNVPYRIGVRANLKDSEGTVLDDENPYVSVDKEDLRAFTQANKVALSTGALIQTPEPPLEIITPNSISDEEALDLVSKYFVLRKRLPEITSEAAILKLLNAAKASKRPEKTLALITERFEEISPAAMQGEV